jgi:hypothetical protein
LASVLASGFCASALGRMCGERPKAAASKRQRAGKSRRRVDQKERDGLDFINGFVLRVNTARNVRMTAFHPFY